MLMMDDTNTKVLNMVITCMKFLNNASGNMEKGYHDNHIAPWYKVFIAIRM